MNKINKKILCIVLIIAIALGLGIYNITFATEELLKGDTRTNTEVLVGEGQEDPNEEFSWGSEGGGGSSGGAGRSVPFIIDGPGIGQGSGSGSGGGGDSGLICVEEDVFVPYKTFESFTQWWPTKVTEATDATVKYNDKNGTSEMVAITNAGGTLQTPQISTKTDGSKEDTNLYKIDGPDTTKAIPFYSSEGNKTLSIAEAYVVSHYSYGVAIETIQKAFWKVQKNEVPAVANFGSVSGSQETALAAEAATMQAYLNAGSKTPNIIAENPTVHYDKDKETFLVGPYKIDYDRFFIKVSSQVGNIPGKYNNGKMEFSGITSIILPIIRGDGEKFDVSLNASNFYYPNARNENAGYDASTGYKFPHPNEEFYLKLTYDNIYFTEQDGDFASIKIGEFTCRTSRYSRVEGNTKVYDGNFSVDKWDRKVEPIICEGGKFHQVDREGNGYYEPCKDHGLTIGRHTIGWTYILYAQHQATEKAQKLMSVGAECMAAVYKRSARDTAPVIQENPKGTITITKIVESDQEEEIDTSKIFKFKVTISGQDDRIVELTYGQTETITVGWDRTQAAPTYKVEEIEIPSGYELREITNAEGTFSKDASVAIVCTNKRVPVILDLTLMKEIEGESNNNTEFTFRIWKFLEDNKYFYIGQYKASVNNPAHVTLQTVNNVTLKAGDKLLVQEVSSLTPEGFEFVGFEGVKQGVNWKVIELTEGTNTVTVKAVNKRIPVFGRIEIKKELTGNNLTAEDRDRGFTMQIMNEDNTIYKTVTVSANTPYVETIEIQDPENPPKFRVTESPEGLGNFEFVGMDESGYVELKVNDVITFTATNMKKDPEVAVLKIRKSVNEGTGNFTFRVTIKRDSGVTNEIVTVPANGSWSKKYLLDEGESRPTYTVEEINIPEGYSLTSITGASGVLEAGKEVVVNATNTKAENVLIPIGGRVWEDLYSEDKPPKLNGTNDSKESGVQKVEVYVKKQDGSQVQLYDGNGKKINQPLYTDANGNWSANVKVPKTSEDYYVEFIYDGQTYTNTTFLSKYDESTRNFVEGSGKDFMSSSTEQRNDYANKSMAKENETERASFNAKFEEIYGKTAINQNKITEGQATNVNTLTYESKEYKLGISDETRLTTKLQTRDSNGYILDQYKISASTLNGGITYTFDSKMHLEGYDKTIENSGEYTSIYAYLQNINLGLVRREEADLGLTKDLYSANIVVNQKLLTYRYNTAINFTTAPWNETLNNQIRVGKENITYKLELYKSDYFYRTSMYNSSTMRDAILSVKADTELSVYLTYRISLINESQTYKAKIKEIVDYYDSDLTLISSNVVRSIKNSQGEIKETVVAEPTYYNFKTFDETGDKQVGVNWQAKGTNLAGSNGKVYSKMTTNSFADKYLDSGEQIDIYVTFEVNRTATLNDVADCIVLGEMSNIAEISRYSTYNLDGSIAGKVDKDSAPDNIDIINHNEKSWYEDDSDEAPIINIRLYDEERSMNGIVWKDAETETLAYEQKIGNGIYNVDENDTLLNNMTVELVEKIEVDGVDYEYIWPETFEYKGKQVDLLGLTGLSSRAVTGLFKQSDGNVVDLGDGEYKFTGVPAGIFTVRFRYGDTEASVKEGINGQDYKSTIYQAGISENIDTSGYLKNVYHDLTNEQIANNHLSDARDSEFRRMAVIAYSRTMINENASVLASADDINADHTELINNTNMVAETAKINLEIEFIDYLNKNELLPGVELKEIEGITNINNEAIKIDKYLYNIKDIDFGVEERSGTTLKLDKQITRISLTTSDSEKILEAFYENGKLIEGKGIETNKVQSINNNGTAQGFRYINIDEKLMQGATIEIEYNIKITNEGEVDRVGELVNYETKEEIEELLDRLELSNKYTTSNNIEYGRYLGTIYYTGEGNDDAIVVSKIEQVIDYVDNNAVFKQEQNNTENHAWVAVTTEELRENKLLDKSEITMEEYENGSRAQYVTETENGIKKYHILDGDGVMYETEQRSNLVINAQDEDVNNKLVIYLVPQNALDEDGKYVSPDSKEYGNTATIDITISKYVSPQEDSGKLTYTNLAEIIKFKNTVGRRDMEAVVGNANPSLGAYVAGNGENSEHDAYATEVITLTPPTGLTIEQQIERSIKLQVLIAAIALAVVIVLMKKFVFRNKWSELYRRPSKFRSKKK